MELIRVKDFKLIFEQGKHKGVWGLFDPQSKYSHCEMLANDGFGWILIRSHRAQLKIYTLPLMVDADPSPRLGEKDGITVISTRRFKQSGLRVTYLGPWTCVEVCKAMMGLSCWWITTPDMLLAFCSADNKGVKLSRKYVAKSMARSSIMYLSAPFVALISVIYKKLRG